MRVARKHGRHHVGDGELAHELLHPHPAARWCWFDEQPIYSIWSRNHGAADMRLVVWSFNQDAIRLYEALGYRTYDRAMRKFLDAR